MLDFMKLLIYGHLDACFYVQQKEDDNNQRQWIKAKCVDLFKHL